LAIYGTALAALRRRQHGMWVVVAAKGVLPIVAAGVLAPLATAHLRASRGGPGGAAGVPRRGYHGRRLS
jgi:hypothetical protein